jgi:hypothetical protein
MAGGEERVPHLQEHRIESLKPNKGDTPMFHVHSIGRKIIYPIGFYYAFFGWENFAISPGKVVGGCWRWKRRWRSL